MSSSTLLGLSESASSQDFDHIPIIDLSTASSHSPEARARLAAQIRQASLVSGFFYISHHSVPAEVIARVFQASDAFFAQADEVKASVDYGKSGGQFRGYMKLLEENQDPAAKGELHEAFNLGLDPSIDVHRNDDSASAQAEEEGHDAQGLTHGGNLWPAEEDWAGASQFKQAVLDYYTAILRLGQTLFPLFALAMELDEHFFDDKTLRPAAIMRLLRYPGVPPSEVRPEHPGIGAHTDYECFTVLCQDKVSGLQVQNKAGDWLDAPYIPGTFVVNLGDQFARWTNDIFRSTPHRVLPPAQPRLSIPFFFGTDYDVPLVPPASCVGPGRPNRYTEVLTAGEYVQGRLRATYG